MENSIELIKSRLDKVTPGKWEWEWEFDNESTMPILKSCCKEIMDFGESETYYPCEGTPPNKHDAEFIVNAKSDIEYLLEELDKTKTALTYYSNIGHYEPYCIEGEGCDITEDAGYIAREALGILNEDEK